MRRVLWACCLLAAGVPAAAQPEIDPSLLAGLSARSIGPATMSGRIAAIAGAPSDPDVLYVGAATGGVWRSTDGGLTFEPVFDDQPVAAIGAVAVSPLSPEVVWVGTGEGNPRNSASVGNGVYVTRDGGDTWRHLGLDESERIHRILLHPTDPDTAWVAAMGRAWGENRQRGVFKTEDGGESWQQVLYVNDSTGAADLVIDPQNPDKLIAAMWDYRRWPWSFRSGGPGSGIHVSRDGGRSWTRSTDDDGLPKGELGRVGLAIAPSDPSRVYALIETKEEIALYRSDDGAASFRKASSDPMVGNRPFYYADLRVDPADPNRVYSLWSILSASSDGGATFRPIADFSAVHPDHHAMWIDPTDPEHIWNGNDGGIYESRDRGKSWRFVANLPLAQYYHVRLDDETPFNVYGGMQDNGSWKGPSAVWENGGIRNHHWQEVGFGDGFDTAPLPGDPMRGFAMSQEGYLSRWDLRTGERKDVRPPPPGAADGAPDEELRFNWNAGFALDPFDPNTVYYGSQFLHRSRDLGDTWEIVSPDLTTDNPEWQKQGESGGLTLDVTGAENFTTIVAVAPSPLEQGLVWVGTDDGRLWITRDGAETWTSLEERLPGVPANTWIPHVAPSPHEPGTAFVVLDNHRRSDWTPYVYRTTDYGASWTRLADADDVQGYALVIEQDPFDPDLLWLGTEFGLWASVDGGGRWMKWTHGVPTVSVMDLVVHPRTGDLVLGTHGRSAYVLDDPAPLRELTPAVMAEPLHLFPIGAAQQYEEAQTGSSRFPGHGEFRGENRPYGAFVTVSLSDPGLPHPDELRRRQEKAEKEKEEKEEAGATGKERMEGAPLELEEGAESAARRQAAAQEEAEEEAEEEGEEEAEKPAGPKIEVEVADASGEVIRTFEREVHRGVNRLVWDLRHDAFDEPPRPDDMPRWWEPAGPEVLPGEYTVTVRYGGHEASQPVTVLADPRFDLPLAERRAKLDAVMRAGALQEALVAAIERLHEVRRDVDTLTAKAKRENEAAKENDEDEPHAGLVKQAGKLNQELGEVERKLWTPPQTRGIPPETDAMSKLTYAQRSLGSSYHAPTPAQQAYLAVAEARTREALAEVNRFLAETVAPFREAVRESGLVLLPEASELEMP